MGKPATLTVTHVEIREHSSHLFTRDGIYGIPWVCFFPLSYILCC